MTHAYNMDCMEYMRTLPDNAFDLAVVDPPYGIKINMNMGRKKGEKPKHANKKWDDQRPSEAYFRMLMRVSKNQIIWGGKLLRASCDVCVDLLEKIGPGWRDICGR